MCPTPECGCGCGNPVAPGRRFVNGHNRRGLPSGRRLHGHAKPVRSPTYVSWCAMRARCMQPGAHAYELYGGRGIKICAEWDSFEQFLADMGERPAGMSLDRVDTNGNYEPDNCRWATVVEQRHNQRRSS